MGFFYPYGLFSLFALLIVAGIYFFHRRYVLKKVSALFLWESVFRRQGGGTKLSTIERSLLLLIELLIVLFLALALGVPGCIQEGSKYRIVFVLDDSASMSAKDSGGISSKDRAAEAIISFLKDKSPFDADFILSEDNAEIIASGLSEISSVKTLLERWQPSCGYSALEEGIALGFNNAGQNGYVYVASDMPPPRDENGGLNFNQCLQWNAFGKKVDNVAFVNGARREIQNSQKEEIFAEIANYSGLAKNITLAGYKSGVKIFERNIKLAAEIGKKGENARVAIEMPPAFNEAVELRILEEDALSIDNSMILFSERKNPVSVIFNFEYNDDEARLLQDYITKAVNASGAIIASSQENAEIIITDTAKSVNSSSVWKLVFPRNTEFAGPFLGPYFVERRSELLNGVLTEGIKWTAYKTADLVSNMRTLISYRNEVLLSEKEFDDNPQGKILIMNYSILRSNMHRTNAWPILFFNLLKQRGDRRYGLTKRNYRIGDKIAALIPPGSKGEIIEIANPKIRIVMTDEGACKASAIIRKAGVYELRISQRTDLSAKFAANFFSHSESDLSAADSGVYGEGEIKTIQARIWKDFSWLFLLIGLMLAFFRLYLIEKKF